MRKRLLNPIWLSLILFNSVTHSSFGRLRFFPVNKNSKNQGTPTRQMGFQSPTPQSHSGTSSQSSSPQVAPTTRPQAEPQVQYQKPTFGRTLKEALMNRPRFFQPQEISTAAEPFVKIFCEDPYKLVCETSMDDVQAESWPNSIFPRDAQGAFGSGKKILSYLADHYFEYNESSKKAIKDQIDITRVLVTSTAGPMAYSEPPRVEVPPTYWNLFSVFHELGHIIDFRVTYPLDRTEVVRHIQTNQPNQTAETLAPQISQKQAEIAADKIAAKGFAFLADPNLRKVGFEPISQLSLLKTIKAATGFLCGSPGSLEHPSGKFRINYIGKDRDLKSVLGCSKTK